MVFLHLAEQIHAVLVFVLWAFSLPFELTFFCLLTASPHLTPDTSLSGLSLPTHPAKYSVTLIWFFFCSLQLQCWTSALILIVALSSPLSSIYFLWKNRSYTHGFNYYLLVLDALTCFSPSLPPQFDSSSLSPFLPFILLLDTFCSLPVAKCTWPNRMYFRY